MARRCMKRKLEEFGRCFICPITGEPMEDPVVAADGETYERHAITDWLHRPVEGFPKGHSTSPITKAILPSKLLQPNNRLKRMYDEWIAMKLDPTSSLETNPDSQVAYCLPSQPNLTLKRLPAELRLFLFRKPRSQHNLPCLTRLMLLKAILPWSVPRYYQMPLLCFSDSWLRVKPLCS